MKWQTTQKLNRTRERERQVKRALIRSNLYLEIGKAVNIYYYAFTQKQTEWEFESY